MRCLTITCNPAVDTTYVIGRLVTGEINRVREVLPAAGGKGNNVARVLAALGQTVVATGLAGGHTGRYIAAELRAAGVTPDFVEIPGESRRCLTIVEDDGRITEVREPGESIDAAIADAFLFHAARLARGSDVVAISGSLAPGLPVDYYARLIAALRPSGALVALDSSGEALAAGLAAGPDLVKPNEEELAALAAPNRVCGEVEAARGHALPSLAANGRVLLSRGARGAVAVGWDDAWSATPPAVEAVNTVGCGDALLAGYLDGRDRFSREADAMRHAVAVASASAERQAVGAVDLADVARIRAQVAIANEDDAAAGDSGAIVPFEQGNRR